MIDEVAEELEEDEGMAEGRGAAEREVAEDMAEARENVGRLRRCMNAVKVFNWGQALKQVGKIVLENAVAGAVFWGVSFGLNKLAAKSSGREKQELQTKQKKMKAMAQLISDISDCFHKLSDWIEDKKDITVDAGDGVMVPLPDILIKYTKSLEKPVETISSISSELYKDDGNGKKTFAVPTIDQVNTIISNSALIVNGLQDIVNFANEKKEKFPELSTMPIKQYDVDKLDGDVEKVKKLPYA